LYINEAGHIRYANLLARLLPNKYIFVHIRLLEDCSPTRLKSLPRNVRLITVSNYLKSKIEVIYPVQVIYDPYTLLNDNNKIRKPNNYTIGVVGRVTKTKGLDNLIPILKQLSLNNPNQINCHFYGSYDTKDRWFINFKTELNKISDINIKFKNFVSTKQEIYSNIDILIHLNKVEALGRILFEAVDFHTPFLTFNQGGCGELAKLLKLNDFLIEDNDEWINEFVKKINDIADNKISCQPKLNKAKDIIRIQFNPKKYSDFLESIFSNQS
jgi:glycosyltransferase involved in cell wall biosynthesis